MGPGRRLALFALIACSALLSGQLYNVPGRPHLSVGGGPSQTLFDDFASDANGWSGRSGGTCTHSSGEIELDGAGACHYSGESVHGTQPGQLDQWAALEFGSTASLHVRAGPGVRKAASSPTSSDHSYTVVCDSDGAWKFFIKVCNTDDANCVNLEDTSVTCNPGFDDEGDQIALMVSNTSTNTEICAFWWDSADTEPSDWSDVSTWGDADYCISSDGTITDLASYSDCGTGTTCSTWDEAPDVSREYADTNTDVAIISVVSGANNIEWFRAGTM